jgi:Endonuclease related to archaeal Holliday junction resolvase
MKDITGLDLGLVALLVLAIVAIVILWVKMRRLARQVAEFPGREAEIRADARKRSRTSHMASISEQLAPLLPGFRYNPKDLQWIGVAAPLTPSYGTGWRRVARSKSSSLMSRWGARRGSQITSAESAMRSCGRGSRLMNTARRKRRR